MTIRRNLSTKINWDSTLNLPQTTLPIRSVLNDDQFRDAISNKLYQELSSPTRKDPFTLIDGPPFANGDLHVGHALNKLLKDSILRLKGQQGHRIEFRPAWDCHGLPIELKALNHSKNITPDRFRNDPSEIRSLCRKFAKEALERQKASMQNWGIMADFDRPLLTMDPKFEANQLRVLAAMVDKDLIYSAKKPVYYSPSSQTALAEAELEYRDDHVSLTALIKFDAITSEKLRSKLPDKSKKVSFVAWTTTPWTLPSNKALAVGRDICYSLMFSSVTNEYLIIANSRIQFICISLQHTLDTVISDFCMGSDLSTCHYISLQFTNDSHKINPVLVVDFVTDDSGSGVVHLAPDYGTEDFGACKSVGITPNQHDFLNDNGDFSSAAPSVLQGMNIFSGASETILEYLRCTGNFLSCNYYTHRYPYDWRTGKPVIQRATRQWFASISSILPQLKTSIESVRFIPENGKDKLWSMLQGRTDWCISRQRHWGLPIPALRNKDAILLDAKIVRHVANLIEKDPNGSDIWWSHDMKDLLPAECGNYNDYKKTFDTLDVWFDSGTIWNNFKESPSPTADLYLEGSDQYRGWFQSSLITSVSVTGKAPYRTVLTHGFVLDHKGQKMSKSIGNVVDPNGIVKQYGSDVLRLWAASSNFKTDVNIGPDIIKQVAETKRKIRNTLRFIIGNIYGHQSNLPRQMGWIDNLMMAKLSEFQDSARRSFNSYDFPTVIQELTRFCVQDLSAFYFEILKDRLYTETLDSPSRQSAQDVLIHILTALQDVISPLLPILSEEIRSHYTSHVIPEMLITDPKEICLNEFNWIQNIRSEFLEWFNCKGKQELSVKSTFQLDLNVSTSNTNIKLKSEDLREIFMAAHVELVPVEGLSDAFKINSITASNRQKCPRCWTFNSIKLDEPCQRCIKQTATLNICKS